VEEGMFRGVRSEWKGRRCFCHSKNGRRIDVQGSEK